MNANVTAPVGRAAGDVHLVRRSRVEDGRLDLRRRAAVFTSIAACRPRPCSTRLERHVLRLQEVGDLVGAARDLRLHRAVDVDAHREVDAALEIEAEVEVLRRVGRPARHRLLVRLGGALVGRELEVEPARDELVEREERDRDDERDAPVPGAFHLLLRLRLRGCGLDRPSTGRHTCAFRIRSFVPPPTSSVTVRSSTRHDRADDAALRHHLVALLQRRRGTTGAASPASPGGGRRRSRRRPR